ncbi:MAG: hypothetical protein DRO11_09730, partial [Methanobacteriota archaeon]
MKKKDIKYFIALIFFFSILVIISRSKISECEPQVYTGYGSNITTSILISSEEKSFEHEGIIEEGQDKFDIIEEIVNPKSGTVYAGFGEPIFTEAYWHLYNYGSSTSSYYVLFRNSVFRIRYQPTTRMAYQYFNATWPITRQNFTVPAAYDEYEAEYVWVVVKVPSGCKLVFHAEIWNYGPASWGTSTETVTVNGPYDWWIALKLISPRTLHSGTKYYLEIHRESGSVGTSYLLLYSYPPSSQDNGVDYKMFYNDTDNKWYIETDWMLVSVLTKRESFTYQLSLSDCGPFEVGKLQLNMLGKNIPKGTLTVKINDPVFGSTTTPKIFLTHPLVDYAFTAKISGSYTINGGTLKISTNLGSLEQSRSTYDSSHYPIFPRPFALLALFTDPTGKPSARWKISTSGWWLKIRDKYGFYHTAPNPSIEQDIENGIIKYKAKVSLPYTLCLGYISYKMELSWNYSLSTRGTNLITKFTVSPSTNATWTAFHDEFEIKAKPNSKVEIWITPIPRDWELVEYSIPLDSNLEEPIV